MEQDEGAAVALHTAGERAQDLVVLVPAHDEEAAIGGTLDSLATQTVRPGRVVVVADRCTDRTEEIARARGAEVVSTVGNRDRKAGALDQALARLDDDRVAFVMVLDADTRLGPEFVETATDMLRADERLGAVSGIFTGEEPRGYLERCQANEYVRYRTQILTTRRVSVVTGTASVFRLEALRDVAAHRGSGLPGLWGDVYDRHAITEDSELTLALKSRGWALTAPPQARCRTELMPTWGDLHRQRVRWYKGMLDNLRSYGLTRVTARYVGQQVMIAVGALTLAVLLVLTVAALLSGAFVVRPFWLGVGGVFVVERVVTAWDADARGRVLAVTVAPELLYALALQVAFAHAAVLALARRDTGWNHVASPGTGTRETRRARTDRAETTRRDEMYELNATSTGALAMTGASIAQGWVAVWTLIVAGLALVSVARVAYQRSGRAPAGAASRHARGAGAPRAGRA